MEISKDELGSIVDPQVLQRALAKALEQITQLETQLYQLTGKLKEKSEAEQFLQTRIAHLEQALAKWEASQKPSANSLSPYLIELETLLSRSREKEYNNAIDQLIHELEESKLVLARREEDIRRLRLEVEQLTQERRANDAKNREFQNLATGRKHWEDEAVSASAKLLELSHELAMAQKQRRIAEMLLENERKARLQEVDQDEQRLVSTLADKDKLVARLEQELTRLKNLPFNNVK